ncbi:hypothetical protein [Ruficoccus sp. ZRK36]|uniref:hypothetical protein n=1 Tax=Ruficoccus sp. ZRK36 TaxID=2866311 RepID=UPI001C739C28|nr:hypothetical protein [Ruficoccus sp. ZRK36]QYY36265.1 hypothetical protein K0V07_02080 [Ruficoccus sp. ZRK36]
MPRLSFLAAVAVLGCMLAACRPATSHDAVEHGADVLAGPLCLVKHVAGGKTTRVPASSEGRAPIPTDPVLLTVWESGAEQLKIWGGAPGEVQEPGGLSLSVGGRPLITRGDSDVLSPQAAEVSGTHAAESGKVADARAPILLRRIDDTGGEGRIYLSESELGVSVWNRDVFWEHEGEVRVIDNVATRLGEKHRYRVTWWLWTEGPVTLEQDKKKTIVDWPEATLIVQSGASLRVTATPLAADASGQSASLTLLTVESVEEPPEIRVMTRLIPEKALAKAHTATVSQE